MHLSPAPAAPPPRFPSISGVTPSNVCESTFRTVEQSTKAAGKDDWVAYLDEQLLLDTCDNGGHTWKRLKVINGSAWESEGGDQVWANDRFASMRKCHSMQSATSVPVVDYGWSHWRQKKAARIDQDCSDVLVLHGNTCRVCEKQEHCFFVLRGNNRRVCKKYENRNLSVAWEQV